MDKDEIINNDYARYVALEKAITVHLQQSNFSVTGILDMAEAFYHFLTSKDREN